MIIENVLLFLVFFILFTKKAHAYIDPGTGSQLIQILITVGLGSLFAVKLFFQKIFKNKSKKSDTENDKEE